MEEEEDGGGGGGGWRSSSYMTYLGGEEKGQPATGGRQERREKRGVWLMAFWAASLAAYRVAVEEAVYILAAFPGEWKTLFEFKCSLRFWKAMYLPDKVAF